MLAGRQPAAGVRVATASSMHGWQILMLSLVGAREVKELLIEVTDSCEDAADGGRTYACQYMVLNLYVI